MVIGENGIIPKAQFAELANNIGKIDEAEALEKLNKEIDDRIGNKSQIATIEESMFVAEDANNANTYYKITGNRLDNTKLSESLKATITAVEDTEDFGIDSTEVELYQIDMQGLNLKLKKDYIINIVSGKAYQYKALKYKGLSYHRPELGVNSDGEIEEEKAGFEIDKNEIRIVVGQKVKLKATYDKEEIVGGVTQESENTSIATVTNGIIEGKALGETKVKVKYNEEEKECKVTVIEYPTEIYTIEDLNLFSTSVNNGHNYENETVKLMNDLDFKNASSYLSTETDEYADYYIKYTNNDSTDDTSWNVIGNTTNYFKGTFDGQNKTITNLYINENAQSTTKGLFGYSLGGTFRNLKLKDVNITAGYYVGALVGAIETANISNIKVTSGSVEGIGYDANNWTCVGGIVGTVLLVNSQDGINISNCENKADITGAYMFAGGINGWHTKGNISNCKNSGEISCGSYYLGGITGSIGYALNAICNGTIENCENSGRITGTTQASSVAGGIAGCMVCGSKIENCTNTRTGIVTVEGYNWENVGDIGGIVGYVTTGENQINNCKNYANVTGSYNGVGGVAGFIMNGTATGCYNYGNVTNATAWNTGGIAGFIGGYDKNHVGIGYINRCYNYGEVSGLAWAGGITGVISYGSQVTNSDNHNKVTTTGYDNQYYSATGGICGGTLANNIGNLVEDCKNYGAIESNYMGTGGISGWLTTGTINRCTNNGVVKSTIGIIGGIAGEVGVQRSVNATVSNCTNTNEVTVTGTGANGADIGGIVGLLAQGSTITKCGNTGDISTTRYMSDQVQCSYIGGIVGVCDIGTNIVSYCYNTGSITADYAYVGGILGSVYTGNISITNSYSKGAIQGPTYVGAIAGNNTNVYIDENVGYLKNSVTATVAESPVIIVLGTELESNQVDAKIAEIK